MEKFKATLCYLRGKTKIGRSDDGGALVSFAPWGVIHEGTHGLEGTEEGFFGGVVLHPYIDGDGSRRRGAVQIRSLMWEDGLAEEDDAVWRRGGVDGMPGNDDASVLALERIRRKTAAVASESAPDRCVTLSHV